MKQKQFNFLISWFILTVLMIPVFSLNALGTASKDFYSNWQLESDVLAIAKIDSVTNGVDLWDYGLLVAQPNQMAPLLSDQQDLNKWTGNKESDYVPYQSQIGLQGKLLVFLSSVGIDSLSKLQFVNALLFSIVFSYFILIIFRISNMLFAACVVATTIFSPWMVAASHSLFWAAWSWFLPAIFAYYFVTAKNLGQKIAFGIATIGAFVFRFGSGYEFLTSFTLFAAGMPLLIHLFGRSESVSTLRQVILQALSVVGLAVSAFFTTLLLHANLRGHGNIPQGIADIINQDVLRRTYGDPGVWANPEIQASLLANPLSVIKMYVFNWNTEFLVAGSQSPFTFVFGPQAPWVFISLAIAVITIQYLKKNHDFRLNSIMLLWASSIPFSWYVLAKSHSFIHTQINYVLWYLFFAAVLLYIPLHAALRYLQSSKANDFFTTRSK